MIGNASSGTRAAIGCVVLTMGRRPEELRLAVDSLLRQRGVEVDIVVVGQAWDPVGLPDGVRGVHLPENVGIPAGRNAGVDRVRGDLVFFLDEDAALRDDDALAKVEAAFDADPGLGLVQLRVEPRDGGPRSRDWLPRLTSDVERTGDVTLVWEGAVAIPRRVLEAVGRWPARFMFVHEGIDLAWRVMDRGLAVRYLGDVVALHPSPPAAPVRHAYSTYHGARNKVWLARRYLPRLVGVVYVGTFALRTLPRLARAGQALAALRGYRDGLRTPLERTPLRARTLWRMARAGRPPLI